MAFTREIHNNYVNATMLTCSLGRSMSNLMRGGTPPARRMPFRLLLSLARLASVLAAISVVLCVEPESSSLTSRWMAPASLMAEKNWSVVDRFPTTAAARSMTNCNKARRQVGLLTQSSNPACIADINSDQQASSKGLSVSTTTTNRQDLRLCSCSTEVSW